YVIHTVGPVWGYHGGHEAELLAACYHNSLALAAAHKLESIAFPSISTGAFGYPRAEAAQVAAQAISSFLLHEQGTAKLATHERPLAEVRLVFFAQPDADIFLRHQQFPP